MQSVASLAMKIFENDAAYQLWLREKPIFGENTAHELVLLGAGDWVEQYLKGKTKELSHLPVADRCLEMAKAPTMDVETMLGALRR